MAKLPPNRHPQADFFIPDLFNGLTPFKDDIASMEHPIFSLSKNKDLRTIDYVRGDISITIIPSVNGLPTIFDKDVLLFCAALLMAELNQLEMSGGSIPKKTLRISPHDLLKSTNRATNDLGYDRLEAALKRLHGVSITTNIKTNGIEQISGFHLIESYHFIKSHYIKDRRVALEITLSDWFYNAILGKDVLTISRDYFRLGKPLERRLYEIARKHCGNQNEWRVSMLTLHEKSGSTGTPRMLRHYVKEIAKDNHLPDYTIEVLDDDMVLFRNRKEVTEEPQKPDILDIPSISYNAIRKGELIVARSGTGWDFDEIYAQFTLQLMDGFRPARVDGAFINFVKKKVKLYP